MRLRWLGAAVLVSTAALGCSSGDEGGDEVVGPGPFEVAPAPAGLSDAEVVARAGAAVWRVETEGCDWVGSGSAFAVDRRHLVTNRHVIANDVSPQLVSPTGERRAGRVIGAARESDVAVIEVDDDLPVTLRWAPTDALQPTEHLVVLGYPAPAHEFTATVGSIVNFQGRDGAREAMLTDAPIGPGNSGGPGLRTDASVAGVVTQMALDDATQRAAIIFTAASVRDAVEAFIAEPQDVLSDCGQGPDYVPPIPDHFDVPAVPPPPPTTATTAPLPVPTGPRPTVTTPPSTTRPPATTRPNPPPTTPTTAPEPSCPATGPTVVVRELVAEPGTDDGTWDVTATVEVANEATAGFAGVDLAVAVPTDDAADPVVGRVDPAGMHFEAGRGWTVDVPVGPVVDDELPEAATATLAWRWLDPDVAARCPADPVTVSFVA